AARVGEKFDAAADELSFAIEVRPAAFDDVEPIAMFLRDVEDCGAFRATHPFVSVGGKERDVRGADVHRNDADRLNRVNAEEDVASPADSADRDEIRREAVVERDGRDADETRVVVDEVL